MKKIIIIVAVCLVGLGCNKLKGDRGDRGDPGPGQMYFITGFLTSNSQVIEHRDIKPNSNVSVFIDGGDDLNIELPVFLPPYGVNSWAMVGDRRVEIYNGLLAGSSRFEIIIVTQ